MSCVSHSWKASSINFAFLIPAPSHSTGINYNAVNVKMTYPTTVTKLVNLAIPGDELMCTIKCFSDPDCKASYIDNGGKCGLISNLELGIVSQSSIKLYVPNKSKYSRLILLSVQFELALEWSSLNFAVLPNLQNK